MRIPTRITFSKTGEPKKKYWDEGYTCWLIKDFKNFCIIGYKKYKNSSSYNF